MAAAEPAREKIVRHLQEYLGDRAVELNPAMKAGLAVSSFAPALIAGPVKSNVAAMARQFVAGETPVDLVAQLRRNAQRRSHRSRKRRFGADGFSRGVRHHRLLHPTRRHRLRPGGPGT